MLLPCTCPFDKNPELTRQQTQQHEQKLYKRKVHHKAIDFLEEMHQKQEEAKLLENRLLSEAIHNAPAVINMKEVAQKARINTTSKPVYNTFRSQNAVWREKTKSKGDIVKLAVIA